MDKKIEQALKKVENLKKNAQEGIDSVKKEIEEQEKIVAAESKNMESATVVGDFDAYEKAKKNFETAQNKAEMLRKRYEILSKNCGVAFEDGVAFADLVHGIQDKKMTETIEQLKPLFEQVRAIMNDALKVADECNDALRKWHYSVRKFQETDAPFIGGGEDNYFIYNICKPEKILALCRNEIDSSCFYELVGEEKPSIYPTVGHIY